LPYFLEERAVAGTVLFDNEESERFSGLRMLNSSRGALGNPGHSSYPRFDFREPDAVSANLNEVAGTALNPEIPIAVSIAKVAGLKPAF
jgi:hypothetical protein